MIRVLVNGAHGKMGQESVRAISNDPALEVVAEADLGDNLPQKLRESRAEVAVDFTTAESGFENAKLILAAGVRPVIGTSGFTEPQVNELKQLAARAKLGGLVAPNFAIGAVLMMKFAAEAAKYLPAVEILEMHHDKKADSPSGTAIRTAEMIVAGRSEAPAVLPDKAILPGARGANLEGVRIHSMRLPGVVAQQIVLFGGVGQTLRLEHNSLNRESFMPGVVLACKKVIEIQQLVYGLENLL